MRVEEIPFASDYTETCFTCGSRLRRRYEGQLHGGTFILNSQRMDACGCAPDWFRDPIILDGITQYFNGKLYRVWPSQNYYTRGSGYLHIDVWEAVFGKRPKGVHIHHRDGNITNNELNNLECMPDREHLRLTYRQQLAKGKKPSSFGDSARQKAAEWHKSPAGLLWHKRNAERSKSWLKWKREPRQCPQCGKEFLALVRRNGNAHKFCSTLCKTRSYYQRRKSIRATARCVVSDR